jgi:2'-5' RNA ligase
MLSSCVENLESRFADLGVARESKPFSPHITIGRVRRDRSSGGIRSAVERLHFDPVVQPVESLTLFSSVLSQQGPTYTRLCSAAFV